MKCLSILFAIVLSSVSSLAMAEPKFDRDSWVNWRGQWQEGMFSSSSQYMSCVANDGSIGAPEFWAAGHGDNAGLQAFADCLSYVNTADRNPAYIEIECGY